MTDTKPIRQGEELNINNLAEFLRGKIGEGEISISQFPSGNSNLTYCIRIGETEYVLRRPPFGNQVKSAHDMSREFNVLAKLSEVYQPAPKPLIYCNDENCHRLGILFNGTPQRFDNSRKIARQFS